MEVELDSSQRCTGKRQWPKAAAREIQKSPDPFHYENGAVLEQGPEEQRALHHWKLDVALGNPPESGRWPGSEQRIGLETSQELFALK